MYFDESAVSVVDSWLQGSAPSSEELPKKKQLSKKAQPKPQSEYQDSTVGRKGLGYVAPVVKPKSKAEEAVEGVLKNIQKKKKYTAPAGDLYESHGLVEDEISKIRSITTTGVSPVVAAENNVTSEDVGLIIENRAQDSKSNGFSRCAGMNKTEGNKDTSSNPISKKRSIDKAVEDKLAVAGAEEHARARKRTKTRSKQKNIRRDKRADAFKPEHLRIGTSEYCGYPLTEVQFAVCVCLCCVLSSHNLVLMHRKRKEG